MKKLIVALFAVVLCMSFAPAYADEPNLAVDETETVEVLEEGEGGTVEVPAWDSVEYGESCTFYKTYRRIERTWYARGFKLDAALFWKKCWVTTGVRYWQAYSFQNRYVQFAGPGLGSSSGQTCNPDGAPYFVEFRLNFGPVGGVDMPTFANPCEEYVDEHLVTRANEGPKHYNGAGDKCWTASGTLVISGADDKYYSFPQACVYP